jgi:hypothetical protein
VSSVLEREGLRDAGRRDRHAELLPDDVEDHGEPRVSRARPPDGQRQSAAWSEHAADLAAGARRVRDEHQPLAAEYDVERGVRFRNPLEVEDASRDVVDPQRTRPLGGDRGHLGRDIRDHDLARRDQRRDGEADAAGPARELEDSVARLRSGQLDHPFRHRRSTLVDEGRVRGPAGRDARPHAAESRSELLLPRAEGLGVRGGLHDPLLSIRYSIEVMNSSIE